MSETPEEHKAREEEALRRAMDVNREQDEKLRREHEAAEGMGAAAAGAFGCLSISLLPFTAGALVIFGVLAVWAIKGCTR
jgi:hypothetical protein